MIILGIDPGLNHTGYGVIEAAGSRVKFIMAGVINVPKGALGDRLAHIHREVDAIAKEVRPDLASCEKVFVNVNPASTLLLGQARGAAIAALAINGLEVREFNPTEVKMSVVGAGRATKDQVQAMVKRILAIEADLKPDAADALAIAITAAQSDWVVTGAHAAEKTNAGLARRRHLSGKHVRQAWETALGVNRK